MYTIPIEQLKSFIFYMICGCVIGILFDIFRIIRKSFKISDFHTYIEDLVFGIILGLFLIYILFILNKENIRLYMIISISLGIVFYWKTISKYFIDINVRLIRFIKTVLYYILLKPIKLIIKAMKKIFNKPYMLFIINIKKIKDVIKYQNIEKKLHKKKDFTE